MLACKACSATSRGVSRLVVSMKGLAGVNSSLVSLQSTPTSANPSVLIGKTRKGTRNNFIGLLTRCVPIVILYEYFTNCPLYEGGASLGRTSRYITVKQFRLSKRAT